MDVARVKALALNAGSSSLKAALHEVEPGAPLAVKWITTSPCLRSQVNHRSRPKIKTRAPPATTRY